MEKTQLVEVLNNIRFKGLEDKKCGDALFFLLDNMEVECITRFNRLRAAARVLRGTLWEGIGFQREGDGRIAFLFSNSYAGRSDYREWFDKITGLCEEKCRIVPAKKKLTLTGIKYIGHVFRWIKQCRNAGIDRQTGILISSVLYEGYADYIRIIGYMAQTPPKLFVTLCDTHLIDSLVVQEYNSRGVDTATLQHGSFSASWVLQGSPSKFFLAYGKFTEEQCILSGMRPEKIRLLGMPHQIGVKYPAKVCINNKNAIGVIFCGGRYAADDIRMLKTALEYGGRAGYKVYVKLHPGYGTDMYEFDGWKEVGQVFGNEINIGQFAQKVKFSITAGSTVLVEYMMKMIPVFSYDGRYKIYQNITWCQFQNADELEELDKKYFADELLLRQKMTETREYFCISGDIAEHYREFFRQYE